RDPEFAVGNRPGRVRVRAFGSYNFRIGNPGVFFKEIVGTQGLTTSDEITGYLKRLLVSKFTQAAGASELSVADMAAHYSVLEDAVKKQIAEEFAKYGLLLTSFVIENISLPPEVEKALDAAAAQSARGVDNTMAWEGMQVMREAARNPGSGSGAMNAGMGMGMGVGMGSMMGNMMQGMMQPQGYPQHPGYPPPGYQGYPPQQGYPPPGYPPQPGYGQQPPQQPQQQQAPAPADNSLEGKLLKLKAAFDAGLLTEDEFKAKKMQLLDAF
ncbi:MAG: SPFH domain-containing protein, partial [Myxococcales bacterium]|nr:SPFH domain-containing protein [Myxococcales bacterium]